jgi:hypothetical protein
MGRMARGYAAGGSVAPGGPDYWVKYADTIERLRALQEISVSSKPADRGYTSVGTFAGRLLDNFWAFSDKHRSQIATLMDSSFDGWYAGVQDANKKRLPSVVEFGLLGLLKRYAGGGGTDTMPAMLTPGEWVMSPRSVEKYGGGLMHAINQMRVPRAALERALSFSAPRAPAHFATGGPVGMVASRGGIEARGGAAGGSTGAVTFNIYAQKVDEAEVRRSIIPVLDKINRKSR